MNPAKIGRDIRLSKKPMRRNPKISRNRPTINPITAAYGATASGVCGIPCSSANAYNPEPTNRHRSPSGPALRFLVDPNSEYMITGIHPAYSP